MVTPADPALGDQVESLSEQAKHIEQRLADLLERTTYLLNDERK